MAILNKWVVNFGRSLAQRVIKVTPKKGSPCWWSSLLLILHSAISCVGHILIFSCAVLITLYFSSGIKCKTSSDWISEPYPRGHVSTHSYKEKRKGSLKLESLRQYSMLCSHLPELGTFPHLILFRERRQHSKEKEHCLCGQILLLNPRFST